MNMENWKERWLVALRSGKYTQGPKALKQIVGDAATYCCLGVLCEILEVRQETLPTGKVVFGSTRDGSVLPIDVAEAIHIQRNPRVLFSLLKPEEQGRSITLAELNDKGVSFERIAELVEATDLHLYKPL